jgi:hypothetical protein
MDSTNISNIRRFALLIAVILITLVLAGVELENPVRMSPLGIPLVIKRPDLLTVALVIAAAYSILRYTYYGMLLQPSPMRARRELIAGRPVHTPTMGIELANFVTQVNQEVDRYFPRIGKDIVTFSATQEGMSCHLSEVKVPSAVRTLCWVGDIDFLLPILANLVAIGLWAGKYLNAS